MFEGFTHERVRVTVGELNLRRAGSGPAVLLLHGYPQTHVMWHRVAPALARRFSVVCPDLRGYGDSVKPASDAEHRAYSKRASAVDLVELMRTLGHERFAVVGHDRGARVAHRLALDHPEAVTRAAFLDVVPTRDAWAGADMAFGIGTYHWFFLAQPFDLPERLIGSDPGFFLRWHLRSWSGGRDEFFDPAAVVEYERCFRDPRTIHASCEDYRAGATIDLADDLAHPDARVACPTLILWGERGRDRGNVMGVWRERALEVRGHGIDAGHFLAEERPDLVIAELEAFLHE